MATGNILAEGNIDKLKIISVTLNPSSVAANSTATQTVTVPGVRPGDFVYAIKPIDTAGFGVTGARSLSPDTVQLSIANPTGSAADPGSETWLFLIARSDAILTAF